MRAFFCHVPAHSASLGPGRSHAVGDGYIANIGAESTLISTGGRICLADLGLSDIAHAERPARPKKVSSKRYSCETPVTQVR